MRKCSLSLSSNCCLDFSSGCLNNCTFLGWWNYKSKTKGFIPFVGSTLALTDKDFSVFLGVMTKTSRYVSTDKAIFWFHKTSRKSSVRSLSSLTNTGQRIQKLQGTDKDVEQILCPQEAKQKCEFVFGSNVNTATILTNMNWAVHQLYPILPSLTITMSS